MPPTRHTYTLATIATLALPPLAPAELAPELRPDTAGFTKNIQPFLGRYCTECHDADQEKGDVRLDTIDGNLVTGRDTALWMDVLHLLETHEMPPPKKAQPPGRTRDAVAAWLRRELEKAITAEVGVPGRVVVRRLSRTEYRHTVQDLLGLPVDIGRELPPDTQYEGFDNVAAVQELSPSQLQTYLAMAREAVDRALVTGDRPPTFQYRAQPEQGKDAPEWRVLTHGIEANIATFGELAALKENQRRFPEAPDQWTTTYRFGVRESPSNQKTDNGVWLPASNQFYKDKFNSWGILSYRLPYRPEGDGLWRLRVKAGAKQDKELGRPVLTINVFKRLLANVDVTAPADDPQWYEFVFAERDLKKMPYLQRDSRFEKTPITDLVLNNNYENPGFKPGHSWQVPKGTELPALFIDAVELEYGHHAEWPPASHRRLLFDSPNRDRPEPYAKEVLSRFMARAYRRPVRPAELERKMDLFRTAFAEEPDFVRAIKEPLVATLVSPQFLFLSEDAASDDKARRPLDDFELASRLSYFLWSRMPDDGLFKLASQGTLTKPQTLSAQVDRLLDDPRAAAFHHGFMTGWLRLDKLDSIMIEDNRWTRSFTFKDTMWREPVEFFAELLRRDASLLNFVDSDFAVINERLAWHYGIPGVYGNHFRPVKLDPQHARGGLMTQAACMTITTDGMITNPIYRGVWVMDRILDRPPPEAPANVPPLDDAPAERLDLREQLARHREDPGCASCHQKIDPVGWPFEAYSIMGEYRPTAWGPNWEYFNDRKSKKDRGVPDLHGVLPGGTRVDTVQDLKDVFLENHRKDLLRSVVKHMMVYALGRPLDLSDKIVVRDIVDRVATDGFKARALVHAIVTSKPFLEK